MRLIVNGQCYDNPHSLDKKGGEGELYALASPKVAKVYKEPLRSRERAKKVHDLCTIFQQGAARGHSTSIAFPEFPAYEADLGPDPYSATVGFSMHYFDGCPVISRLQFDPLAGDFRDEQGVRLNDETAVGFVFSLFALVDRLHAAHIVLADVNNGNVLYNPHTRLPIIIDIDSAQIAGYSCPMMHPDYIDPMLLQRAKNTHGGFAYSAGTDTFALAVVSFEFLIGQRPFEVRVKPADPDGELQNRIKGISSIKCLELGTQYLRPLGFEYADKDPMNKAVAERLRWLKDNQPELYEFFRGIFIDNKRESLVFTLDLNDRRHPGHRFFIASGAKEALEREKRKIEERRRAAAQMRQGARQPSQPPTSGAHQVIAAHVARSSTAPASHATARTPTASAPPTVLADPAGFEFFLQHFGLDVN